jgi:hypothetical protein
MDTSDASQPANKNTLREAYPTGCRNMAFGRAKWARPTPEGDHQERWLGFA